MKRSPLFGSKAHTDFLRKARETREEKPDPLDSDPFYVLGQLKQVLTGTYITGLSRSPTQRLREARAILSKWEAAKAVQKAAGKGFYIGRAP